MYLVSLAIVTGWRSTVFCCEAWENVCLPASHLQILFEVCRKPKQEAAEVNQIVTSVFPLIELFVYIRCTSLSLWFPDFSVYA